MRKGRPKVRRVSETPTGVASLGKAVRDLLAHYSKADDMKETRISMLMYGYLAAKLGTARVYREHNVSTLSTNRQPGRPEQIDFVIGRTKHNSGQFEANTVIEFAVRRTGQTNGADPIVNLSEIAKLVRANATHRVLLLLDLTNDDLGKQITDKYKTRGYSKGRPRGKPSDKIDVIYVGEHGTKRVRLKRQLLAPKKAKKS